MALDEVCKERLIHGMDRAITRIFDSELSDADQKNFIRKAIHDINIGALGCEDTTL